MPLTLNCGRSIAMSYMPLKQQSEVYKRHKKLSPNAFSHIAAELGIKRKLCNLQ